MNHVVKVGLLSLFLSPAVLAAEYELDAASSPVTFKAVGKPGFLKIKGEGGKASGKVTEASGVYTGKLTLNMADFKTGIDMRDEHMHGKYLESQKFPLAELTLKSVTFTDKVAGTCKFDGDLTIKAVTKPIQGECAITGEGTPQASVKATMLVKLEDYPVGVPSHLGVTVADTVTVEVDAKAKKKE